jgi:RNA-directed DNA polymerase
MLQAVALTKVIEAINPILRGWVNYSRVGNSSRCFAMIKDWVEKKIRVRRAEPAWNRG